MGTIVLTEDHRRTSDDSDAKDDGALQDPPSTEGGGKAELVSHTALLLCRVGTSAEKLGLNGVDMADETNRTGWSKVGTRRLGRASTRLRSLPLSQRRYSVQVSSSQRPCMVVITGRNTKGDGSGCGARDFRLTKGTVRDEGLKKLLMSWYYAGYYTGYYEGQQAQQQ